MTQVSWTRVSQPDSSRWCHASTDGYNPECLRWWFNDLKLWGAPVFVGDPPEHFRRAMSAPGESQGPEVAWCDIQRPGLIPPGVPTEGGWVVWHHEGPPPKRVAAVLFRDGTAVPALYLNLRWRWTNLGCGADIVAYQLPAAPSKAEDGWIEWAGGECPVSPETPVEVRFRADCGFTAGFPLTLRWDHRNLLGDIVAYRVHASDAHEPFATCDSARRTMLYFDRADFKYLDPRRDDGPHFDPGESLTPPESNKPSNPKDIVGARKAPMSTVSAPVMAEVGVAMLEGAAKYGRHNYRAVGVRSSVYYDATMRHLFSWWEGEDIDADSNLSHITKAIASLVVLRDAMLQGKVEDDRPPPCEPFYVGLNAHAAATLDKHADKNPHHYTRKDSL